MLCTYCRCAVTFTTIIACEGMVRSFDLTKQIVLNEYDANGGRDGSTLCCAIRLVCCSNYIVVIFDNSEQE